MLAPGDADTSPQDLALSPLSGHARPAPHRLCQPWHGLYFMHQLLARRNWAEQTLSLRDLTVVIPVKNATLFGEGGLVGLAVVFENQAW